jgi:hypothetical protein
MSWQDTKRLMFILGVALAFFGGYMLGAAFCRC